jgi:CDGSH-type Zn-finger protein
MSNTLKKARVVVAKNGPYLVTGSIQLSRQTIGANAEGASETWIESHAYPAQESYALCRCGRSNTKPFCNGMHTKVGFDGTETASRDNYESQAKVLEGPEMDLLDAEALCAFARFCDPNGQVWSQVDQTQSPVVRESFIRQVGNCPSGRLVARDRSTQKDVEPELPVSIGLVEDPAQGCSGPLWLRGLIPVAAADGFQYEVRNRVTLCRCGQSKNKPFCDGTHASVKFGDE